MKKNNHYTPPSPVKNVYNLGTGDHIIYWFSDGSEIPLTVDSCLYDRKRHGSAENPDGIYYTAVSFSYQLTTNIDDFYVISPEQVVRICEDARESLGA